MLCELSTKDSRYPKYPMVPVRRCDGFENKDSDRAEVTDEAILPPD